MTWCRPDGLGSESDWKNVFQYERIVAMTTRKKILVTGGCGFVGRHLVHRLAEDPGNEITVVDDLSTGAVPEKWPAHLKCRIDRLLAEDCVSFFEKNRESFDVVFHLAAVVEGRMTIDHNPLRVAKDLIIDAALFRWAVETTPGKIVYFSSSAAYPIQLQTEARNTALREDMLDLGTDTLAMPDMSYGWAKLTGEFLSKLAVAKHGLKVAVYRPFSGYGEDQAMTYPFPSIIQRVLDAKGEIEVWGSGEQSRDFIYIEDCIDAILMTYENISDASPLNLGTGVRTSFNELIRTACRIVGKEPVIKPLLEKPVGVFARYCDPAKQKSLGFAPKTSLEEGIRIVLKHLGEK
jgi:nucleoside-diphosphate-sugar epimerase